MPRLPTCFVPGLRAVVPVVSLLVTLGSSSIARAECPPGSWFCADATPDKADDKSDDKAADKATDKDAPVVRKVGPGESTQVPGGNNTTIIVQTAPPPPAAAPAAPPPVARPRPRPVYTPPPPATRVYSPPPPARRYRSEWGFNMRLQSALMDSDKNKAASDAGMGGLGFSLRARPTGHFAIDFGLDFLGGKDFQGNRRSEVPFSINAMLFFNPRDRAQVYMLGGFGWSTAHVTRADDSVAKYSYFGLQSGIGLEFRATRHVAFNLDLMGFIRGRTDKAAAYEPEFVDPATNRTTNTSGGGLLRGGLTVYW